MTPRIKSVKKCLGKNSVYHPLTNSSMVVIKAASAILSLRNWALARDKWTRQQSPSAFCPKISETTPSLIPHLLQRMISKMACTACSIVASSPKTWIWRQPSSVVAHLWRSKEKSWSNPRKASQLRCLCQRSTGSSWLRRSNRSIQAILSWQR